MDRASIKEILQEVLGPNVPLIDHENWVGMHCAFAPWKHERGTDATPSAGVSVNPDDSSVYHCFSCHSKGTLGWFLKEMERYTGENYSGIIRGLVSDEFFGGVLPEWGAAKAAKRAEQTYLDEEVYLNLYEPAQGHPYLRERSIPDSTAESIGLMIDPSDSEGEERIVFPVYDQHYRLVGLTGRATRKDARLKVRDYHGFKKAMALLGSHLVLPEDKQVVLVEGLFDYAKVYSAGYAALAVMHSGLTDHQARILLDIGLPVVLMYDNDNAGRDGSDEAASKLVGKLPVSRVAYPRAGAIKDGYVWRERKDPGSCRVTEIDYLVAKARIL